MRIIFKSRIILDLFASLMFFTRIPVNWKFFSNKPPNLTDAAWSFPLIGYLIGIVSGLIGDLCLFMNLSILLSCTIAIAFSLIITGAFHEDGLADMESEDWLAEMEDGSEDGLAFTDYANFDIDVEVEFEGEVEDEVRVGPC